MPPARLERVIKQCKLLAELDLTECWQLTDAGLELIVRTTSHLRPETPPQLALLLFVDVMHFHQENPQCPRI